VLLCVHLLAVFMPPFAFQSSPIRGLGSPLVENILRLLRPYTELAYLNHGYAFFAPDPGPSHLLRAELRFDDGRPPQFLTMPDIGRHWPRLLYHRYFMLSEHFNASFAPPAPPPEASNDPDLAANWRLAREMYELRRSAIKDYLRRRYGADKVELVRLEHQMLSPAEKLELDKPMDAGDTYLILPETMEASRPE
jgi:hypothetical protein